MIGVPFYLGRDNRPGRGEGGYTVKRFTTVEDARVFLAALPREAWMPGTKRLAASWGVQP